MNTHNLGLPYIAASQAQKHVTHAESLTRLDTLVQTAVIMQIDTPPSDPDNGAHYLVSASPQGDWEGRADSIAVWLDGGWTYYAPREGFTLWNAGAGAALVYTDGKWTSQQSLSPKNLQNLPSVGINAQADAQNPLSVSGPASLFNNAGNDHRLKINKNAAGDTGSFLFQTGFSGRAEMGLMGDDAFRLKASADGTIWDTHLTAQPGSAGIITPAVKSGKITVGFEQTAAINTPASGGIVAISMTSADGLSQAHHSGLFVYDTGQTPGLTTLAKLSGIVSLGSAALTGTTGADNKTSLAVSTGLLHIENRFRIPREYTFTFIC